MLILAAVDGSAGLIMAATDGPPLLQVAPSILQFLEQRSLYRELTSK